MTARGAGASERWDAIVIHRDDDVAVALRDLAAGETARARRDGALVAVTAAAAIPLGHKIALRPIAAGTVVRKYGEAIGAATAPIAAGDHVHVHNVASQRARRSP
ncbi:MAG: UxaA family hydrolase [Alphaproteobacteria bacterium]|nr:UxaA family hydrolase [Alphaproteobacteria bacterium]